MKKYQLLSGTLVKNTDTGAIFAAGSDCAPAADYAAWTGVGNTPMPVCPGPTCEWDDATETWVESLEPLRTAKLAVVNTVRLQKVGAGIDFDSHPYKVDPSSAQLLAACASLINGGTTNPHNGYWRDEDDVDVSLTDAQLVILNGVVSLYTLSVMQVSHTIKADILAASTVTELEAIDVTNDARWPGNAFDINGDPA